MNQTGHPSFYASYSTNKVWGVHNRIKWLKFTDIECSVADPYIKYTDPDPALFVIYGSGSRLFYDTKIIFLNFFFEFSNLYHISFDYEGIPLKQMKKFEKISNKFLKSHKIFKMFKFVVSF